MQISCPNCTNQVELRSPPVRGPSNDGSNAWICLRCSQIICVECYHEHTQKKHQEMIRKFSKKKK